jgi:hypothetical protein
VDMIEREGDVIVLAGVPVAKRTICRYPYLAIRSRSGAGIGMRKKRERQITVAVRSCGLPLPVRTLLPGVVSADKAKTGLSMAYWNWHNQAREDQAAYSQE